MTVAISIQGLKKSFGQKEVLRGVDLEINPGTSMVVIGGSGSGKSVLLKSIIGLILPDEGSKVMVGDQDLTFKPIISRQDFLEKFGMLFQGGALFDSLTIWQNVCFSLIQSKKISVKQARDYAIAKLELVGLKPEVADLYPAELSGGMQKRAALARAIAADPSVIFFDEPTAGLDPIMANVIAELISSLSTKLGATTITITHDMRCVGIVANKVAMLYEGSIVWHGDKDSLLQSGNQLVDNFINGRAS